MPIELTPDVKVTEDASGKVRQLSHHQKQYKAAMTELRAAEGQPAFSPRSLAEQYLRDVAPIFGFAQEEIANFAAARAVSPTAAGVELRFKEEKAVGSGVTVVYEQTIYGLPIWNAGVTVRVDSKEMGVIGSHNAAHYDIEAQRPARAAAYLPNVWTSTRSERCSDCKMLTQD